MVEDYGLDGVDIDYEFPETTTQGEGLASLVTELRTAFDALQKKKGDSTPYLVTVRALLFDAVHHNTWCAHDVSAGCYQRCVTPIQVLELQEDGRRAQLLELDGEFAVSLCPGDSMRTDVL